MHVAIRPRSHLDQVRRYSRPSCDTVRWPVVCIPFTRLLDNVVHSFYIVHDRPENRLQHGFANTKLNITSTQQAISPLQRIIAHQRLRFQVQSSVGAPRRVRSPIKTHLRQFLPPPSPSHGWQEATIPLQQEPQRRTCQQ